MAERARAADVARYILKRTGLMSPGKLHKLCYYAQGWHLAWTGESLFEEDFEAWDSGPVCPELARAVGWGSRVEWKDVEGDAERLSAHERDSVDAVLKAYSGMEGWELSDSSTRELPWQYARRKGGAIPRELMQAYYGVVFVVQNPLKGPI